MRTGRTRDEWKDIPYGGGQELGLGGHGCGVGPGFTFPGTFPSRSCSAAGRWGWRGVLDGPVGESRDPRASPRPAVQVAACLGLLTSVQWTSTWKRLRTILNTLLSPCLHTV